MTSPLLTTRDVAARLGVSPETVLRRWRSGELPGFRIGSNAVRFDADELTVWLEARRGPASDPHAERGVAGTSENGAATPAVLRSLSARGKT